jgi:hypothetical protein
MLDTWPWEAVPSFSNINDLLKVSKPRLLGAGAGAGSADFQKSPGAGAFFI